MIDADAGTDEQRDVVLFVSLSRGLGGPARSLLTVLSHLDDDLERTLLCPLGDLSYLATAREVIDTHVPIPRDPRRRVRSRLRAALEVLRHVRANRGRLVAVHANGQSELHLCLLASLLTRVRIVMWAHTSVPSPTAGLFRAVWRRARRVTWLAVSPTARDTLVSTLHLPPDRVHVVPNPVDAVEVVGARVPSDVVRVAYLGLAVPHKGFDLLGRIIEGVGRDDIVFDLYVDPPSPTTPVPLRAAWETLHEAAQRHPVQVLGWVTDVAEAYGAADIVLCPSRHESFGRIAVEAMLNGLPVVASDIDAFRRLHELSDAVSLFSDDDPAAAAAAIVTLADDPGRRQEVGARGREAARCFLPERVVPELDTAYRGRC